MNKASPTIGVNRKKNTVQLDQKNLSPSHDLASKLIQKEISACAQQLNLDECELNAWIDQFALVPAKIILYLLRIAQKYQLDPLHGEVILAQYDQQWHTYISVDGWIKLLNRHPAFSGISFNQSEQHVSGVPVWMECTIHRSDRVIPTTAREYLCEVSQNTAPWTKMPRRMLRHRTLAQCARIALGIGMTEPHLDQSTAKSDNAGSATPKSAQHPLGSEVLKRQLQLKANNALQTASESESHNV